MTDLLRGDWMIKGILFSVVTFALLASIVSVCATQKQRGTKSAVSASNAPSGAELYAKHCVACHGDDLKGNADFPPPYRVPPNLTTLARRHGGKFPDAYVVNVLRNGVTMPAHGPAEMPVWGTEFAATDQLDKLQVMLRIKNLTQYIKSRQIK